MKLSQVAPLRWCRQANRWALHLSPWRYAALMASGVTFGVIAGQWLADTDHSLAKRFLLAGSNWVIVFLGLRLVAPAMLATARLQQQWREERRQSQAEHPRH